MIFGFDFTTIVQSDDYSRADLDLLSHYVAGRTSIICAGLIDAITLPQTAVILILRNSLRT